MVCSLGTDCALGPSILGVHSAGMGLSLDSMISLYL